MIVNGYPRKEEKQEGRPKWKGKAGIQTTMFKRNLRPIEYVIINTILNLYRSHLGNVLLYVPK